MTEQVNTQNPRTTSITVISIIGMLGAALSFPLAFMDSTVNIASWYPAYLGASALAGFTCMIGMWKMKKWGIFGYASLVLINQAILLSSGLWDYTSIFIPAIIVCIGFFNIKDMN